MKTLTNHAKQDSIEQAWEDLIKAISPSDITIQVEDGTVILNGTVDSYARKLLAERIVADVTGVKFIVNCLKVRITGTARKKDAELLDGVLEALNKDFNLNTENSLNQLKPKTKTQHHPALVTTQDFSYWEIFC